MRVRGQGALDDNLRAYKKRAALSKYSALAMRNGNAVDDPSARPPGPAQVLPGTTIRVALGIQGLRARVFRGVELEDHPLRIRNARIRRRVQEPDVVVGELKVHGTDVVLQLLGLTSSHDHAADRRPPQEPREGEAGRDSIMPPG